MVHPHHLAMLQQQISEAHAELKRGIDSDWRQSVVRYPEVLDYFFSLVRIEIPGNRDPSIVEPPYSVSGIGRADRIKEPKKKRREGRESVPPPERRRSRGDHHAYDVSPQRMMKVPSIPVPPMPPMPGSYGSYGYGGY